MDERKYALVIGINEYRNGIPRLVSAVPDAQAVAATLASEHGYAPEVLLDAAATVGAIEGFLAGPVVAALSEEDSFVFYYAGHGVAADADGKGPQGFLLPQDADRSDPGTWFGMDSLREALGALKCRHVLLVLDCCYAGAFQWTSSRDIAFVKRPLYRSQYERYRKGVAWHVLTSASHDETADDAAPFTGNRDRAISNGHSPFARALIDGLSSTDADSSRGGMQADGVITATELYQYIYEKVAVDDRQTPGIFPLKEDNKGEFVFMAPGIELNLEPDPPLDDANNPWLGLGAYSAADRELFFGRNAAVAELLERVETGRLVAVVGASGSGKTSLVRAGLLPALEGWTVVEAAPANLDGAREQLAVAPEDGRQLIVIDRFEELFAQPDGEARARFLDGLRELIAAECGPTVLVALRSDFEPQAAAALGELWAAARYGLPELGAEELREVILGPARAKAMFFEPANLVDRLILAVNGRPGAVPLLSLTLSELYQQARLRRRESTDDRMLTAEDYGEVGGPTGVLHRRATALLDQADTGEQETIRRVSLRFVSQENDGLKPRRVYRDELDFGHAQEEAVSGMLDRCIAARLLVVGSDGEREYVEPAHEALATTWDRQLEWLAQSGSQKVIRDAWVAADDWDHKDGKRRASRYLWNHNPHLLELERREKEQELNALEQEFRGASSKRKKTLRRRLVAITASVIAALLVAGVVTLIQRNTARTQRDRATLLRLVSDANGKRAGQLDEGLLESLGLVGKYPRSLEARSSMLSALEQARQSEVATTLKAQHGAVKSVAFNPKGDQLAAGTQDGTVQLWNVRTHKPGLSHRQPGQIATSVEFSPKGDRLAVGYFTSQGLGLWDIRKNRQVQTNLGNGEVSSVAFSSDGQTLHVGTLWGYLYECDVGRRAIGVGKGMQCDSSREPTVSCAPYSLNLLCGSAVTAVASSDNSLAVGSDDSDGAVLLRYGNRRHIVHAGGPVTDLAFGPRASGTVAASTLDGRVRLYDVRTGVRIGELIGQNGPVKSVAFSPDGRMLAAGNENGTVQLWDTRKHKPLGQPLNGYQGVISSVAFGGSDGHTLAAGTGDGTVLLWDIVALTPDTPRADGGEQLLDGGQGAVTSLAFSSDGRMLAAGTHPPKGGAVLLWDVPPRTASGQASFRNMRTLHGAATDKYSFINAIAFSPNRRWLAAVAADKQVLLWRLRRGQRPSPHQPPMPTWEGDTCGSGCAYHGVAFGPNSDTLVLNPDLGGSTTVVALWSRRNKRLIGRPRPGGGTIALSPTGQTLAFADGQSVNTLTVGPRGFAGAARPLDSRGKRNFHLGLAFNRDGSMLAAGTDDGRVFLWDVRTRKLIGNPLNVSAKVNSVAFSPDGLTLAVGDGDGTVQLWDVPSQSRIGEQLNPDQGSISSVAFSKDGLTLVAGAADGSVVVWKDILWSDLHELTQQVCSFVVAPNHHLCRESG